MTREEFNRAHRIQKLFQDGKYVFDYIGDCVNLGARRFDTFEDAVKGRELAYRQEVEVEQAIAEGRDPRILSNEEAAV